MYAIFLLSCIQAVPPAKNGASMDSETESGALEDSIPTDSEPQTECSQNEDCDDSVDCTDNRCDEQGTCVYTPDDSKCNTDTLCMDAVCDVSAGCQEQFSTEGSSCDLLTCSDGDSCDGAGACVAGEAEDLAGTVCEPTVACTEGGGCAVFTGSSRCTCACTDGELVYEIQGIIADPHVHPLRGSPVLFRYSNGTDSGWISCPSDMQAIYELGRVEFVVMDIQFPCDSNDSIANWFHTHIQTGGDLRNGTVIGQDSTGAEILRVNFYQAAPSSLYPYDPFNISSYTTCVDHVALQLMVGSIEPG